MTTHNTWPLHAPRLRGPRAGRVADDSLRHRHVDAPQMKDDGASIIGVDWRLPLRRRLGSHCAAGDPGKPRSGSVAGPAASDRSAGARLCAAPEGGLDTFSILVTVSPPTTPIGSVHCVIDVVRAASAEIRGQDHGGWFGMIGSAPRGAPRGIRFSGLGGGGAVLHAHSWRTSAVSGGDRESRGALPERGRAYPAARHHAGGPCRTRGGARRQRREIVSSPA